MKYFFWTGILILFALLTEAQVNKHGPPCGGMDILDVGLHIKGQKVLDDNGIRYSIICADTLRTGFTIALTDTSYQITWFLIEYDDASSTREFPISGTKATYRNAAFIESIRPGDHLSLECVNIEKLGVTSLSTSLRIEVTK